MKRSLLAPTFFSLFSSDGSSLTLYTALGSKVGPGLTLNDGIGLVQQVEQSIRRSRHCQGLAASPLCRVWPVLRKNCLHLGKRLTLKKTLELSQGLRN